LFVCVWLVGPLPVG